MVDLLCLQSSCLGRGTQGGHGALKSVFYRVLLRKDQTFNSDLATGLFFYRKPTWVCPVCDRPATFSTLDLDGYFIDILKATKSDEVEFLEDGSWRPAKKNTKTLLIETPVKTIGRLCFCIAATIT